MRPNPNPVGSYIRANNGKYPLRDYQGRPIRIRTLQRRVALESDTQYTSAQVKPYIQFEGYEHVGARYEALTATAHVHGAGCESAW